MTRHTPKPLALPVRPPNPDKVEIGKVWFEHHTDKALGINEKRPRISWRFTGHAYNWIQQRYQIDIGRDGGSCVEVFEVVSKENAFVEWPGRSLSSAEAATVRVRAFGGEIGPGNEGSWTPWSDLCRVEAGLLSSRHWKAELIEADRLSMGVACPPTLFRREFEAKKGIVSARLYITAHGVYEAMMNGQVVGDHVLAPGWTSYQHELLYQTFDVTNLLHHGKNCIGAEVAEGWYIGRLGFNGGARNIWGERLGLIAQLVIEYEDGAEDIVTTDNDWKFAVSPTLGAEIYDGEFYDARMTYKDWSKALYDDTFWKSAKALPHNTNLLRAPDGPPIRRMREVAAKTVFPSPSGKTIIDFGQNVVGWVRMYAKGKPGHRIQLRHAEALENGELCIRILREAKATDTLVLGGDDLEWAPRFTFHGFRYVEVDGWHVDATELNLKDFTAIVIHTDMERTGWFECSDPMLNKLHENVLWSMRGNFVGIPTDCPQRDERFGYTGDLQAFAPTAAFLYSSHGMLKTWLRTVYLEQKEEGRGVPEMYAPSVFRKNEHQDRAVWGDCMQIAPWVLYQASGDMKLLVDHYDSMVLWIEQGITRDERNLWDPSVVQLGDWLDPGAPANDFTNGQTDPLLVANAYLVHITDLMAKICDILSLPTEARKHRAIAIAMHRAFQDEYVSPNGRIVNESQTAYALAISFNILTPAQLPVAASRLAAIIPAKYHYRIGTGFAGTPHIGHALTKAGMTHVMYEMLAQRECPSWLYPITMGATTIWERWDSMFPDGRVNGTGMTSFNHYALGSVADWMHKVIGGLSALEPGWKKILVKPVPGGGLKSAVARHLTPSGLVECSWTIEAGRMLAKIVVPLNTRARIELPGTLAREVGSGIYEMSVENVQ